eukprot:CAMPEP_0197195112 /NCGR_PEP_ID=MMETSP1423-20130617/30486_1 /TAXON_ID=476441 /ORGANISM="Pseudo-nitzschia heimii, Strain UNC1101" /LENGTH=108 /DNA_ID=CAMNT_0042648663 /DNA_START=506 /DNA_END=832 /DNA_ORIENTATION=+
MPNFHRNILLTCCSDTIITAGSSKRIDPMLKLYTGHPLIINDNIDVENKIANGSMAIFRNVKSKIGNEDYYIINMSGHYVRCAEASNMEPPTLKLCLKESHLKTSQDN